MTIKRLLTLFGIVILFLVFCLYSLLATNFQISDAEAQPCVGFTLCGGSGCCLANGWGLVNQTAIPAPNYLELCYRP